MAENNRGDFRDYDHLYDMYYDEHEDCPKSKVKSPELTVDKLRRQSIILALKDELSSSKPLLDDVLALINQDDQKIRELERKLGETNPYELEVSVSADVDDAVTELKRLQRELRKATKEVRELESAYKDEEKASKRLK